MDDEPDPKGAQDPQAAAGLSEQDLPEQDAPEQDSPEPEPQEAPEPPFDEDKVDDAVLALLFLSLGPNGRAWKGHDWDTLSRLHAKGYIGNPVGKAKSVVMTDDGIARSERLFRELFGKAD